MKNGITDHFSTLLLCITLTLLSVRGSDKNSYTAGVVEFKSETLQPGESPQVLILRNANKYVDVITTAAKHNVDIIVFPECGLTTILIPTSRENIFPYLTEIPDKGENPCDSSHASEVLKLISCTTKNSQMYVVINLDELVHCSAGKPDCSSDGFLFYNTNVVFDRNGTIIAKYRKVNLFIEPEFNVTKTPDHSWFDTDFGVRFGLFICFDILFQEPTVTLLQQKVSNFVYPTAWFSMLPFLTATAVQASWAYRYDVNLLAAGYSNTTNKNAGSGIFAGRDGSKISVMPNHSSTKLLISQISSYQRGVHSPKPEEITFEEDFNSTLSLFYGNLTDYTSSIIISDNKTDFEYVNNGFRCSISAYMVYPEVGPTYRFVAFSGKQSYTVRTVDVEVCGVVACSDSTLASCGSRPTFLPSQLFSSQIYLSISSKNKSLLSYPIMLESNLLSFTNNYDDDQYKEKDEGEEILISVGLKHSKKQILTFALYRNG